MSDDAEREVPSKDATYDPVALASHLANVHQMGTGRVHNLSAEDFDKLQREAGRSPQRKKVVRLSGELIDATVEAEIAIDPLLTFLLNADDPGRGKPAVLGLSASAKRRMLQQLLPRDWEHGRLLISHLEAASAFRNKVAHSSWTTFRIDDQERVEFGTFLASMRHDKVAGWIEHVQAVSIDEMRDHIIEAQVLSDVLGSLLNHLAYEKFSGSLLSKTPTLERSLSSSFRAGSLRQPNDGMTRLAGSSPITPQRLRGSHLSSNSNAN